MARRSGGECTAFEADVTKEATLAATVEAAKRRVPMMPMSTTSERRISVVRERRTLCRMLRRSQAAMRCRSTILRLRIDSMPKKFHKHRRRRDETPATEVDAVGRTLR